MDSTCSSKRKILIVKINTSKSIIKRLVVRAIAHTVFILATIINKNTSNIKTSVLEDLNISMNSDFFCYNDNI